MDELGLNLKNTPLIVAVSRSLSSPALGTNPLIPSNTNSLSVVCEPNKQNVDSALVRVATIQMSMYGSVLAVPAILLEEMPLVTIPTSVVKAELT